MGWEVQRAARLALVSSLSHSAMAAIVDRRLNERPRRRLEMPMAVVFKLLQVNFLILLTVELG